MDSPLSTRAVLLCVLSDGTPQHGFKIIERVRELTGGRLGLHQGSVYPALNALLRGRYVRRVGRPATQSRRGRGRCFELTKRGETMAESYRTIVEALYLFRSDETDERDMASQDSDPGG